MDRDRRDREDAGAVLTDHDDDLWPYQHHDPPPPPQLVLLNCNQAADYLARHYPHTDTDDYTLAHQRWATLIRVWATRGLVTRYGGTKHGQRRYDLRELVHHVENGLPVPAGRTPRMLNADRVAHYLTQNRAAALTLRQQRQIRRQERRPWRDAQVEAEQPTTEQAGEGGGT